MVWLLGGRGEERGRERREEMCEETSWLVRAADWVARIFIVWQDRWSYNQWSGAEN